MSRLAQTPYLAQMPQVAARLPFWLVKLFCDNSYCETATNRYARAAILFKPDAAAMIWLWQAGAAKCFRAI